MTLVAPHRLLLSMDALRRAHPVARKRLVGPDVNFVRELLVTHARATGGWIGWEATTVRKIADALAFVPLAERGERAAGDVEIDALVNQALDMAIDRGSVSRPFATLARGLGFRRALRDTLLELRTAGVAAGDVRAIAAPGSPVHELPAVLTAYERLLAERRLADPAEVLRLALAHFDAEASYVLDGVTALVPGLALRGLGGQLLARLRVREGTAILDADVPMDVAAPTHAIAPVETIPARRSTLAWAQATIVPPSDDATLDRALVETDLFAAATPSEELREVCRRVMGEGLRWDEVEIVATDPDTYGIALDALAQQLGVGVTMLHGVPLARTRIGRALDRWLLWLEDGLPADALRQALEGGELRSPREDVSAVALARELRALRVGWGRARWEGAVRALDGGERVASLTPYEDESDEEFARRRESRAAVGAALATLLRQLLAVTPPSPARGDDRPVRASCAGLARATLGYLDLVATRAGPELQAVDRLKQRLAQIAGVDEPEVAFSGALAALREALAEQRSWPHVTSDRKPWSADGGLPHLTDLAHAGLTGRRRTFVVGLDAERTAGPARQDPLLPDGARRALEARASDRLATSTERREDAAFALGAALARLRGRVTLSYATSGALDGREAGPSPVLLQAWRAQCGDASLSYEQLRGHLGAPASAVPAREGSAPVALLDARDVWLDAIADGALLLDAGGAVRAAFPMLAGGLAAHDLATGDEITPQHGLVPEAGPQLDPTAVPGRRISPSSLEQLGACPLAWFYRYGLGLRAPDDPEYDTERWLDAMQRGSLLHEVFETFATEWSARQDALDGEEARTGLLAIVRAAIARWRQDVPPPGEVVFEAEAEVIRRDALAFLEMERALRARGDDGRWWRFEFRFGWEGAPGTYALAGGATLAVRGSADRVDELPDGSLRIVDYKTGGAGRFARSMRKAPFDGGRQLQPALYAAAVESLLHERRVSRFEYRFPTERGNNEVVVYHAAELEAARALVGQLVEHVRAGAFVPTNDTRDCAYCDYQAVCRASRGDHATSSPLAAWAGERGAALPVYAPMIARRAAPGSEA